jgi:predicted phage tail protein
MIRSLLTGPTPAPTGTGGGSGTNITPNTTGLPGVDLAQKIVGGLLTFGIIACVAGLVISAIVWAVGGNSSNPQLAHRGKTGVLVALGASLLVGGADALVSFFQTAGGGL